MDDLARLQKKIDRLMQGYEVERDAFMDQLDRLTARLAPAGMGPGEAWPIDISDPAALPQLRRAVEAELRPFLSAKDIEALLAPLDRLHDAASADGGADGTAATPSTSGAAHPSRGVRERIARFDL